MEEPGKLAAANWQQQIEQAGDGPDEPILEETDVYKATSSSDFVIRRRLRLYRTRFVTYHNIEENEGDNKTWLISSSCELQPRTAAEIKEPVKKYVRPRGQWAITTLVKPKSSASKGKSVLLVRRWGQGEGCRKGELSAARVPIHPVFHWHRVRSLARATPQRPSPTWPRHSPPLYPTPHPNPFSLPASFYTPFRPAPPLGSTCSACHGPPAGKPRATPRSPSAF